MKNVNKLIKIGILQIQVDSKGNTLNTPFPFNHVDTHDIPAITRGILKSAKERFTDSENWEELNKILGIDQYITIYDYIALLDILIDVTENDTFLYKEGVKSVVPIYSLTPKNFPLYKVDVYTYIHQSKKNGIVQQDNLFRGIVNVGNVNIFEKIQKVDSHTDVSRVCIHLIKNLINTLSVLNFMFYDKIEYNFRTSKNMKDKIYRLTDYDVRILIENLHNADWILEFCKLLNKKVIIIDDIRDEEMKLFVCDYLEKLYEKREKWKTANPYRLPYIPSSIMVYDTKNRNLPGYL